VPAALGQLVERLRADGARFVGVDELDLDPALVSIAPPRMVPAPGG
jgi:hypothetical protein